MYVNHVPIIFITSYLSTPITRFADVVFISASEEIGYRGESLASRILRYDELFSCCDCKILLATNWAYTSDPPILGCVPSL